MAFICHLYFYVLPRAFYIYIWCGFNLSVVWRLSNNICQLHYVWKLALNRDFLYLRCSHRTGIWDSWRFVDTSIGLLVYLYICKSVSTSASLLVSVGLSVHLYSYLYICQVVSLQYIKCKFTMAYQIKIWSSKCHLGSACGGSPLASRGY